MSPSLFNFSLFYNVKRYKLIGRLRGHTDSIHVVAVSIDGKMLAGGGSDGLRLWDLTTREQLRSPQQTHTLRGPVSCMVWVHHKDIRDTLCFGTGLGFLVCCQQGKDAEFKETWSKRIGTGVEITCIACDDVTTHIAIGTRDCSIQLLTFDASKEGLQSLFSVRLDTTVPKTLGFVDNIARDIYVFGIYNGQWHILRGDNGAILASRDTGNMIGSTAIGIKENQFVVDNGVNGFDVHQLDNGTRIRTLPTGTPIRRLPKQVAFGEGGGVIVGGSDHGAVYVFDRYTGSTLDVLRHANEGLVQTITTHTRDGRNTIVCASSGNHEDINISLWVRKHPEEKANRLNNSQWSIIAIFETIMKIGMIFATMAFFYQNLNVRTDWMTAPWWQYNPWYAERSHKWTGLRLWDSNAKTVMRRSKRTTEEDPMNPVLQRMMQTLMEAGNEPQNDQGEPRVIRL